MKQSYSIEQSIIHFRFCIFCNKKKYFFSRSNSCKKHLWSINKRNIQIPCIGIHNCPAFTEGSIVKKSSSGYRVHYICSKCFQQQGEHLYERLGKGQKYVLCIECEKYCNDTSNALGHIKK